MTYQKKSILTAALTKEWESLTVQQGLETFESLMEKAGTAVAREIMGAFPKGTAFVLCGPGNNGGDGYVIARNLKEAGWEVIVALDLSLSCPLSPEAQLNKDRWAGPVISLDRADFSSATLIIDALFGTGLQRPLTGIYLESVQQISRTNSPCVAVDIPSGIHADTGALMGGAAPAILTMALLQKIHLL
tara:strand:+ start:2958 stop:3524 length:567 start_codon:yes stop_codon:yes gene_type:complete